jgi:hypothetical protein
MTTTLVVDDIATDADLAAEFGGASRLNSTQPDVALRNAYRAQALQDVVDALASRTPPVLESDLVEPTQLKRSVVYRTLYKLCLNALAESGDRHDVLAKRYEAEYRAAVSVRFKVPEGITSSSGRGFSYERR